MSASLFMNVVAALYSIAAAWNLVFAVAAFKRWDKTRHTAGSDDELSRVGARIMFAVACALISVALNSLHF